MYFLPSLRWLHLPPFSPACSAAKFNGVHSIELHFPSNFGADHTSITFIGLRGEFMERRRQAVEAVYETKPMPQVGRGKGLCVGEEGWLGMWVGRLGPAGVPDWRRGLLFFPVNRPLPNPPLVQDHKVPEQQGAGWNLGM
jgi:hypothetical protein